MLGRGQYDEARTMLTGALGLLGPEAPKGSSIGVWFSVRLAALCDLSYAAAKLGDVPLARASISEGLSLWEKGNIGPAERYQSIAQWMPWARDYMASSNTNQKQGEGDRP